MGHWGLSKKPVWVAGLQNRPAQVKYDIGILHTCLISRRIRPKMVCTSGCSHPFRQNLATRKVTHICTGLWALCFPVAYPSSTELFRSVFEFIRPSQCYFSLGQVVSASQWPWRSQEICSAMQIAWAPQKMQMMHDFKKICLYEVVCRNTSTIEDLFNYNQIVFNYKYTYHLVNAHFIYANFD